jgi:hypothetical protein
VLLVVQSSLAEDNSDQVTSELNTAILTKELKTQHAIQTLCFTTHQVSVIIVFAWDCQTQQQNPAAVATNQPSLFQQAAHLQAFICLRPWMPGRRSAEEKQVIDEAILSQHQLDQP